ncbi:hypothetical protein PGT21_020254 [Puccinia graminis f. sp. tritici]|uniref:Uncharacterized protein n=1 Tax=Puccinia graminis f. sp. tritici TaxID=56615 RepID=A0A5B0N4L8_PUCGR|nr:hypothetical protein PGTUg99_006279 [Puccinia graminis f. sp. tritici]KAA1084181.1 hypothetical protein PGT21_020254 [Puccinia graminis f. sp. tritici]
MEPPVGTISQTTSSQPSRKDSMRFDDRMKSFEIVLKSLDGCRKDESLIGSRLLNPSSGHLALILEILWDIQRKDSLVGLIARGFDRHQIAREPPTSEAQLPPDLLNLKNDTKLARRIHLATLSVLWMRVHCLHAILTDLAKDEDHQAFRCYPSQRVLNRYFSLSPSGYHRTTLCPYLSRLLATPSSAAAFVEAAEGFVKIWKALPMYLMKRPRGKSATTLGSFPDMSAQLDNLAKALDISETYSDPLDLIKSSTHILIRQTLDWTLDAYRNAATVTKRASLFKSRPSIPPIESEPQVASTTQSEPQVAPTTQSEPQVAPTTQSELQVALPTESTSRTMRPSQNPKKHPREAASSHPSTTTTESSLHTVPRSSAPNILAESPSTNHVSRSPPQRINQISPTNCNLSLSKETRPHTPKQTNNPDNQSQAIEKTDTSSGDPLPPNVTGLDHSQQEMPADRRPASPTLEIIDRNDQSILSATASRDSPRAKDTAGQYPVPCSQTPKTLVATTPSATDLHLDQHDSDHCQIVSDPVPNKSAASHGRLTSPISENHPTQSPKSPDGRPLSSSPKSRTATSQPAPSIPLRRELSTETHQSSLQKTKDVGDEGLTPLSQTLDGPVAPSDSEPILSVPRTKARTAFQDSSVESSSLSASCFVLPPGNKDASQKTNDPCNQGLTPLSQTLVGSAAPSDTQPVPPVPGTEQQNTFDDSVEVPHSTEKHLIQPLSETPRDCASKEPTIQPKAGPRQVPSHDPIQGPADVTQVSKFSSHSVLRPDLRTPFSSQHVRHSLGLLHERSAANSKATVDKPSKKRQRRSTDCGNQARRKRLQINPFVMLENQTYANDILKEFRDDPRLSKAYEQARQIAIQINSEAIDDSQSDSKCDDSGSESAGSGSVMDDENAQLDPAIVEKLKANAARFVKPEKSYFSMLLEKADSDLKK